MGVRGRGSGFIVNRDRIHEPSIVLRFLGIILRVLRIPVLKPLLFKGVVVGGGGGGGGGVGVVET